MKVERQLLEKQLNVAANEELLNRLRVASLAANIPQSQIVREGVEEKIDKLANEKPKVREALEAV